jgi:hypothetical protein
VDLSRASEAVSQDKAKRFCDLLCGQDVDRPSSIATGQQVSIAICRLRLRLLTQFQPRANDGEDRQAIPAAHARLTVARVQTRSYWTSFGSSIT